MKGLSTIARYMVGLLFFVFGGMGLLNMIPPPTDLPAALSNFMNAMMETGYFFPFLKLTETVCGLLLLLGIAPALMLIVLSPIAIHIFLLHFFLTPGITNLILPLFILILLGLSARPYWGIYRPLFARHKSKIKMV